MRRALTIALSVHWMVVFALAGAGEAARLDAHPSGMAWTDAAGPLLAALASGIAALAFFWLVVSVVLRSDHTQAGQGDLGKIAVAAGIAATTFGLLASGASGGYAGLTLTGLQAAALAITYFAFALERPAGDAARAANDNDQAAARLLAILAATDAKINRMSRGTPHAPVDFR